MSGTNEKSRRDFLKIAAAMGGAALALGGYQVFKKSVDNFSAIWRLNPAFRLQELSLSEVLLSTTLGNGEKLEHRFTGIEADLLREISRENIIDSRITAIAEKNDLTEAQCKQQLKKCIKELLKQD